MEIQRSKEWFANRSGKITASRFGDVVAGEQTKRHKNYLHEVYCECIGWPITDNEPKPWYQHGIDWEDEARGMYEFISGNDVEEVGYIPHHSYDFIGGSTDGLVNPDGMIEIKCRKSLSAYLKAKGRLDPTYKPQVQGYLWITGRKWCDFVNYYKNEDTGTTDIDVFRVMPDEKYIANLEKKCLDFWAKIQDKIK